MNGNSSAGYTVSGLTPGGIYYAYVDGGPFYYSASSNYPSYAFGITSGVYYAYFGAYVRISDDTWFWEQGGDLSEFIETIYRLDSYRAGVYFISQSTSINIRCNDGGSYGDNHGTLNYHIIGQAETFYKLIINNTNVYNVCAYNA